MGRFNVPKFSDLSINFRSGRAVHPRSSFITTQPNKVQFNVPKFSGQVCHHSTQQGTVQCPKVFRSFHKFQVRKGGSPPLKFRHHSTQQGTVQCPKVFRSFHKFQVRKGGSPPLKFRHPTTQQGTIQCPKVFRSGRCGLPPPVC
jgi:hypothetical protein